MGFRLYSGDHNDKFPWNVPPPNGAQGLNLVDYYRICSNEFNHPKILHCPEDVKHVAAKRWTDLTTNHLSYFIALDADESRPQTILSGDRNITGGQWTNNRVMVFSPNMPVGWGQDIHGLAGNIGLADGSVFQDTVGALQKQFQELSKLQPTNQEFRLAMP